METRTTSSQLDVGNPGAGLVGQGQSLSRENKRLLAILYLLPDFAGSRSTEMCRYSVAD